MSEAESASWRPTSGPAVARSRAAMLRRVREFFDTRGVLEVDTPLLGTFTVTDPQIESLAVRGGNGIEGYLQSSPEYRMKCMLAAGFGDIYQVCKVFRDGERGRNHRTEFTLAEWYRLGFGLHEMIADALGFIATALDRHALVGSARSVTYADAFRHSLDVDALQATSQDLADLLGADAQLRDSLGDDRDAWLDLAFANRVVTGFGADQLNVVYHYPASQSALARTCPDNENVADRFEVFFGNVELANGFVELTDPVEQRARFENDNEKRRRLGLPQIAIDHLLIEAMQAGLPACAGVAVGMDRLLMLHEGAQDIKDISSFAE